MEKLFLLIGLISVSLLACKSDNDLVEKKKYVVKYEVSLDPLNDTGSIFVQLKLYTENTSNMAVITSVPYKSEAITLYEGDPLSFRKGFDDGNKYILSIFINGEKMIESENLEIFGYIKDGKFIEGIDLYH